MLLPKKYKFKTNVPQLHQSMLKFTQFKCLKTHLGPKLHPHHPLLKSPSTSIKSPTTILAPNNTPPPPQSPPSHNPTPKLDLIEPAIGRTPPRQLSHEKLRRAMTGPGGRCPSRESERSKNKLRYYLAPRINRASAKGRIIHSFVPRSVQKSTKRTARASQEGGGAHLA